VIRAPLVLASSSPYRRALLERLGVPFEVINPAIDETPQPGETAEGLAFRLAEAKARAVADRVPAALVVGSDQVAEVDGAKVGKPGAHVHAVRQLEALSGKRVVFHTAVCLWNGVDRRSQLANVPTTVQFRHLNAEQIERYLVREHPYDCAGSARIEGLGIALVEKVVSEDPTALIGLPLATLVTMLQKEGIAVI
jgi:septum formation protein